MNQEETLQKLRDYIVFLEETSSTCTTLQEMKWAFNALYNAHMNYITLLHAYGRLS